MTIADLPSSWCDAPARWGEPIRQPVIMPVQSVGPIKDPTPPLPPDGGGVAQETGTPWRTGWDPCFG